MPTGQSTHMAQSVVYTDLKFAANPLSSATTCPEAPDEADNPYENMSLEAVPVAAVPSPGHWFCHWHLPVGLLAATLLLLATVALGTCYWQVTRSLQDTSSEHVAKQDRLSQELSVKQQILEQAHLELVWARAELQRAWQEGNSSQLELGSRDAELGRARQGLALLKKELMDSQSEQCEQPACLPEHRSKCLFISVEKKDWLDSHDDCRRRSAQLLLQGDSPSWTVPHFVQAKGVMYWIEDRHQNINNGDVGLDKRLRKENMWHRLCATTHLGGIQSQYCYFSFPWICEKPPDLKSPSETFFTVPAKE